jgi:transposase-like protein/ribosomal protein L37AE/L43A
MGRNLVQFQKGLSVLEFLDRYGREEQCFRALVDMRWPHGFVCPHCGGRRHSFLGARRLWQCSACRKQTSVRAGTIFAGSSTSLRKWFLAIYLITQSKNDIAALELARQLGVKWDTAWLMKQKLLEVMRVRNATYQLDGEVQIDDAYLGGSRSGKPGRGAAGKMPFLIAIQTRNGKPIYAHMRPVSAFTSDAIRDYAAAHIAPGSVITSDAFNSFLGIARAGHAHVRVVVTTRAKRRPKDARFHWVNTTLGNVKSAIVGTCRSFDEPHIARYLAGFEWRFNRRFDLDLNVARLSCAALATPPKPYRKLAAVRTPSAETPG